MNLITSILMAAGASLLVGFALRAIFRSLDPSSIGEYRACAGGWWEARLHRCDEGLMMVPQQPINTYSNVAYLAGGLLLAFTLNTLPAYVFSLASLYLCVGSALYHATSTRWAGSLDVSAMYAVFSALAVYTACKLMGLDPALVAFLMFAVAALAGYVLRYKYRGNMPLKIGIFLGLTYVLVVVGMATRGEWQLVPLVLSLVLLVVAFVCWHLDKTGKFPLARWGHGVWHILTAAGIATLFATP